MSASRGKSNRGLAIAIVLVMVAASSLAVISATSPASALTPPVSSEVALSPPGASGSSAAAPVAHSTPGSATPSASHLVSTARSDMVNRAREGFIESGVSLSDFLPPTLNVAPTTGAKMGHIIPLYDYAAAPIGVSTFGLENNSGTTTPYILNTTSLLGNFSTKDPEGIQVLSPYFGTLQAYGDQLNTVLNNTTLFGRGGYDFWLQNVITYNTATNTLSFVLNIWNFSSPSGIFPSNSILHGNGRVVEDEVYETSGPTMTIAYPFTLDLYLNTTVGSYSGSPKVNEVYFNYTVLNGAGTVVCPSTEPTGDVCGEYDNVYFNSGVSVPFGSAEMSANGYQYTPLGLPSDMEMDVGIGQSDGANANVVYANGTVGLYAYNAISKTYEAPPSAYDFGSETGETGVGALTTWSYVNHQPVAYFRTGPSLLTGLWNVSGATDGAPTIGAGSQGAYPLNYAGLSPGNAFIAIAQGSGITNQSFFQVAPSFGWYSGKGALGQNIWLPTGLYTVELMLSGYTQVNLNVNLATSGQSLSVALARSAIPTVYTPLWAYSNTDLANLSTFGSGTLGSPYILLGAQVKSIAPVFAVLNDYLFIVYSGIWVNATTAYFEFNPPPSLEITEPTWWYFQTETLAASYGGTLDYNQLPMYFYHTTNMVVEHAAGIGLWSSDIEVGHNYAVYCNVCTNSVFASNVFNVSSEGLEFLGTGVAPSSGIGHNYVWGNTFVPFSLPGEDTGNPSLAYGGMSLPATGLTVSQSADWIYNNAFYTNGTASSSASSRTCPGCTYSNYWNATGGYQPASNSVSVNGVLLTGSILGQSFQGGNFWFNYGTVADPYGVPYVARSSSPTGTAGIAHGADFAPLSMYMGGELASTVPSALGEGLYPVTFTESGLAVGKAWTMQIRGVPVYEPLTFTTVTTSPTNTTTVGVSLTTNILWVPNGTYTFVVGSPSGYTSSPLSGTVTVNGAGANQAIAFSIPVISTTPTSGPSGSSVSLATSGLAPTTGYTAYFDATQKVQSNQVDSFTTSGAGSFTGSFAVPVVSAGKYYLDIFEGASYIASAASQFTVTTASVTVTPTLGPVGASVAVSATGLVPARSYDIYFDTTSGVQLNFILTCAADATGALTGSGGDAPCMFAVPSVAAGTYHVDLYEHVSGNFIASASTQSFVVTTPKITVSPGQGPIGATVTVAGTGFSVSKLVGLVFDTQTVSLCSSGSLTTAASGDFSCTFAVPSGTSGTLVTATDVGGQTATGAFTVTTVGISVSPGQGPQGASVTVSGAGFSVSSPVGLSFDSVSILSCSSGSLTTSGSGAFSCGFSVPSGTSGTTVTATDLGGQTASGSFTVTTPAITVSPLQGPEGATVTVSGTGFSVTSAVTLLFDNVAIASCPVSGGLTTNPSGGFGCTFDVPSGTSGTSVVATDVGGQTASGTFLVTTPAILVSPSQGPVGATVTVSGTGFSVTSLVALEFDGVATSTCSSGSLVTTASGAFGCTFLVPGGTSGSSVVATDVGGQMATGSFTVTVPAITATPNQGPVGSSVTVSGTGFSVTSTVGLLFDGVVISGCVSGSLGTDSGGAFSCSFAVPSGTSGTTVEATDIGGATAVTSFTVTTPSVSVSPAQGPVGASFSVTGSGFTVSSGATVSFNAALLTPSACSDGTFVGSTITTDATGGFVCSFTVPNVSPGSYSVVGEDLATSTVTSAESFDVTSLAFSVAPSQGPVGATVVASGTGFSVSSAVGLLFDGVAVSSCSAGSLSTTPSGVFSCTFAVPSGTSGTTVRATDSGGQSITATFTVTTPKITVTPKQGPIGATVTVAGTGFSVSSTAGLVLDGVTISACTGGSLGTSPTGAFSCTFHVPSGTSGTTVTATDIGGATATGTFTVTTPTITVTPKQGPIGATVTVSGKGFSGSSPVALVFDGVTISSCALGGGLTTGALGAFSCTFAVPTGTSGTTVTATDVGGQHATAKFTVTTPKIKVAPGKGPVGSTVTISGTGFSVSTALKSLVFDNVLITSCTSGSLTTTSAGAFSCTFTVPSGTSGTTVTATDVGGQYAIGKFTVT